MSKLLRVWEWLQAVWHGDQGSGHPSRGYDSQIERWREYPLEWSEHAGHNRSTTNARYGAFVVCYCYDCERHYRQWARNVPASSLPE